MFNSLNWASLAAVMEVRGFPSLWISWIANLLETSKLVVLVNGVPSPWFAYGRGLRQGDPLSPYLFLLVADVLQQIIKADSWIPHPAAPGQICLVLQYTDDTLLLLKVDQDGLTALKQVLDRF